MITCLPGRPVPLNREDTGSRSAASRSARETPHDEPAGLKPVCQTLVVGARAVYVSAARTLRSGLSRVGALRALDEWAARSRKGLWTRSLLSIYDVEDLAALDAPWWTFQASDIVEQHLRAYDAPRVFEWGSGASTVWLARRGALVTSVEHDSHWAHVVAEALTARQQRGVARGPRRALPRPRGWDAFA